MLRAIFEFHRDVNGWNDIGYNFVIDLFGRIWRLARAASTSPSTGAHAGGYNGVSTGVAILGSFMEGRVAGRPAGPPAAAGMEAVAARRARPWPGDGPGQPGGSRLQQVPRQRAVSLARIAGHRDADATDCPGDVLYGELPAVRAEVAAWRAIRCSRSWRSSRPGR